MLVIEVDFCTVSEVELFSYEGLVCIVWDVEDCYKVKSRLGHFVLEGIMIKCFHMQLNYSSNVLN